MLKDTMTHKCSNSFICLNKCYMCINIKGFNKLSDYMDEKKAWD